MAADSPEWLNLDRDEEILWQGEPVMESIAGSLVYVVTIVGAPLALWAYLGVKNTDFVVTNKRIYRKRGVVSESVASADIDRVQDSSYSQSFFGKQFGFGTVSFSTAGGAGDEIEFSDIDDPNEVQQLVSERAARRGSRGAPGGDDDTPEVTMADLARELRGTREAMERVNERLQ